MVSDGGACTDGRCCHSGERKTGTCRFWTGRGGLIGWSVPRAIRFGLRRRRIVPNAISPLCSDITDEPRRSDESTYDEYVEVSTISRQIFGVLRHNEAGVQAR